MPATASRSLWVGLVIALTFASLVHVWAVRTPPLQDYPQSLWQAHIIHAYGDPASDYPRDFEAQLRLRPYVTFFAVAGLFMNLMPVEAAGKAALSLYPLLVALCALRLRGNWRQDEPAWGVLLLFPVALNQELYLGIINYVYSLPLLLLLLEDHRELSAAGPARAVVLGRAVLLLVALFFTHPFTLLVGLGLASCRAAWGWRDPVAARRALLPVAIAWAFYLSWQFSAPTTLGLGPRFLLWLPLGPNLANLGYLFTGMRWYDGADPWFVAAWLALAATFAVAVARGGRRGRARLMNGSDYVLLGITLLAAVAGPFRVGEHSFVSHRLASVSYFLAAAMVGRIALRGWVRTAFVALVVAIMSLSVAKLVRVAHEIEAVLPLVERLPQPRLLPLVFDAGSPELDRRHFDPHLHAHEYANLVAGGGSNPYLIQTPLFPVRYRADARPVAPGEYSPGQFNWNLHGSYEWYLVRAGSPDFVAYVETQATPRGESGPWRLFQRHH